MNRPDARLLGLLPAAFLFLGVAPASADIVTTTGMVTKVTPPPSVAVGADPSATTAIVFEEKSLTVVPSGGLAVDVDKAGSYHGGSAPAPGTIAAGTAVESYLISSDPPGGKATEYKGSVTFSTDVLGLIILSSHLDNTDAAYGHAGTTYPKGVALRGLESQDGVTLSADLKTVTIDFMTSGVVDEVRVITAVPEPSSLALGVFGLGAAALTARARRRRTA